MPAGSLELRLGKQRLTLDEIDRILPQNRQRARLRSTARPGAWRSQTHRCFDRSRRPGICHRLRRRRCVESSGGDVSDAQLRRSEAPDARTDVYGLGAILYELLTLHPPLDPRAPAEERANRRLVPPAPSTLNSKLPRTLDAVVLQALAVDPDQRYANPGDLADAYLQARVGKKAVPVAAPLRQWPWWPLQHRARPRSARQRAMG